MIDGISMDDKVRFLSAPGSYPGPTSHVVIKETHMSWVFLTDDRAYKLKKPVRRPGLDFGTVAAREANCRAEVRLNRRLAPQVYIGVATLARAADGRLSVGGEDETVDWLVVMRRLPADRMLDAMLAAGAADRQHIVALADRLAGFYSALPAEQISPDDHVGQFRREQALNAAALRARQQDIGADLVERALARVAETLVDDPRPLAQRADGGWIVEGHGDLRPEHVCFVDPLAVIDCLEFSRPLRLVDPFDELSYLALECSQAGAPWVGRILFDCLSQPLGGLPPSRVLAFYRAYRGCLRARLAVAHLDDPHPRQPEKWLPLARRYLALAVDGSAGE